MLRRRKTPPAPRLAFADLRAGDGRAMQEGLRGTPPERRAWLEAGARYGLVEAQTLLGQCLLDAADPVAARRWFALAAEAGHAPAMNMLGRCFERGWGGAVDTTAAAGWYARAAERGLDWAQYNLANALLRGRGIARDRLAAFDWFGRAAGQGHAKSMNLVGRFLEEGWDRPADRAAAADWYRRAAEGGDYRGAYNWATHLAATGRPSEAATWFLRAAREATPDLLDIMVVSLRDRPDYAAARAVVCGRRGGDLTGRGPRTARARS